MPQKPSTKVVVSNRQAFRDYFVLEKIEAGIELKGPEVKSLKSGNANLKDSFARIEKEQIFLHHCHISPYEQAHRANSDPLRTRKLLLHHTQIERLASKVARKGFTIIPLSIYLKGGLLKVELGLAKGKTHYDRREDIKKRESEREIRRETKGRR